MAVSQLFGEKYIKTGVLPSEMGRELNRTFEKRQLSDYEYPFVISDDETKEMLEKARYFIEGMITWLQERKEL